MIYVTDVDKIYPQAIAAGGKELRPLQTQFYGDRSGTLTDPFGHMWTICTHVEDIPEEELAKRAEAAMKEHGRGGIVARGQRRVSNQFFGAGLTWRGKPVEESRFI